MNSRQEKILSSWPRLLKNFARREWVSLFVSTAIGVVAAEAVHLLWRDVLFQTSLISKYGPNWISFDDSRYYTPYLTVFFFLVLLAPGLFISVNLWRGIKSWLTGVTSGLVLLPFASAFSLSMVPPTIFPHRFILGGGLLSLWFLISFLLHLRINVRSARTILEDEFKVSTSTKSLGGSQLDWSDDPIQTWPQDALGRAALVDSLSVKIMIAKAPVLALSGPFGSGKTSILNLLREHLGKKAITVSFSTWLPGSQETLTSYLLADIANECKKQYVVPGLQQSTRQLATALGQKVPFLSEYLKLLPAATQKDHIDSVRSALLRLPKRVVVLLDEIDRMEKDEILTLLKVVRGIASLPNLSFVCAGDRGRLLKTIDKDDEYFEKFFPVLISVPEPDPAAMRRAGTERLVSVFTDREWFKSEVEVGEFKERIESLWNSRIFPFCRNLRTISLLANDVSVAAAPLRGEVDPIDLTLIEMLKRFKPFAHRLIANNSFALTGGESLARGGSLHDEKDEEQARSKLIAELKQAIPIADEFDQVRGVIEELFPVVSKTDRQWRRSRLRGKDLTAEASDKRIREAGIFPAYFRYELPDAIFSSVEMASMLDRFEHAASQTVRETVFLDTLHSMGKGSLKRDDFLRKLSESANSLHVSVSKPLGEAAIRASAEYAYDAFPAFGEAGHVLRMVLFIAQKLSHSQRVPFLRGCIDIASDDTMALRILTILTQQKDESKLDVSVRELYGSFVDRMRRRYGRSVDAANIDLSTSDPWAFDFWGRLNVDGITADSEDRQIQYDFWRRYIGKNRSRLAQAFRGFFLPVAFYEQNPDSAVENKIPVADLRKLYEELPREPTVTEQDRKSLDTLRRFLDGEFKDGIGPMSDLY